MDYSTLIGNLAIGGVALLPLVIGLVALAKRLGMPVKYAPYLNGVLSAGAFGAATLLQKYPGYMEVAVFVVTVILIFLGSSGVYQLSKTNDTGY